MFLASFKSIIGLSQYPTGCDMKGGLRTLLNPKIKNGCVEFVGKKWESFNVIDIQILKINQY